MQSGCEVHVVGVYGFRFRIDRHIPGFRILPHGSEWDVEVHFGVQPRSLPQLRAFYSSPYVDANGEPSLVISRSEDLTFIRFRFSDRVEFTLRADSTEIWISWPQHLTTDYVATYLLGPILGYVLRLRGIAALHASAVAVDGFALAFVGASGAGKSTTAAALAQLGYSVLSDDIVSLAKQGTRIIAHPGHSQVQLWASSVSMLCGSPDALPLMAPDWDKHAYDLVKHHRYQETPLPLGVVYLLDERLSDLSSPNIEPLSPREALIALVANTYVNKLLDRSMRANEFEMLHTLVERVPVRRVHAPADPAQLTALCHGVINDFRALNAPITLAASERSKRV